MKKIFSLAFCACFISIFGMAQYNLAGSASDQGGYFRLTQGANIEAGAVWNTQQIDLNCNFTIAASLYFGTINEPNNNEDPNNLDDGGDGIGFVLQKTSGGVGGAGGGLGFMGISPAFNVEFDTYRNFLDQQSQGVVDPMSDHIAFSRDGSDRHLLEPVPASPTLIPNVEDGQMHTVVFTWNAATKVFTVVFDGGAPKSINIDLRTAIFGCERYVYAGFTAATGAAVNEQRVSKFTISTGGCSTSSCDPPVPSPCGLTNASGYYGGFEAAANNFGPNAGTDLDFWLPSNGSYQVVSNVNQLGGGGYLNVQPKSGNYFFAAHTSNKLDKRVWWANVGVTSGKTYQFCVNATALKNLGKGEKFIIGVYANGVELGTGIITESWTQICGTFVAQGSTVEISVRDPKKGQYFVALDDICLTEVGPRSSVPNQFTMVAAETPELMVNISPNPSRSYFQLKLESSNNEKVMIRVTDAFGRSVKQLSNIQSNTNLSFGEDLKPGNYVVEVIQGNERKVLKLVKL